LPDLVIPRSFKRRLDKKAPEQAGPILECIKQLAANPRNPGLHTHRVLSAGPRVYEAYVDKANRVTFEWSGSDIVLRNHCNHDVLKRNP
jgi:hypothetical protein